jgi:hypothetical protein
MVVLASFTPCLLIAQLQDIPSSGGMLLLLLLLKGVAPVAGETVSTAQAAGSLEGSLKHRCSTPCSTHLLPLLRTEQARTQGQGAQQRHNTIDA